MLEAFNFIINVVRFRKLTMGVIQRTSWKDPISQQPIDTFQSNLVSNIIH